MALCYNKEVFPMRTHPNHAPTWLKSLRRVALKKRKFYSSVKLFSSFDPILHSAGEFSHPPTTVRAQTWIILIPAKNEVTTVASVIAEIRSYYQGMILVIDDHSSDGTAEAALNAGAKVIRLPFSLGAWGATQTGLRYALKHGYQYAITMDADGQHEAEALPVLQQAIQDQNLDVIIGAHPQRGSAARRFAWSLFRSLSGLTLEDLTSGMRAYNRHAIRALASQQATLLDYQDMGVLLLLHKEGLNVREVPISMNIRISGHSRIFNSWLAVLGYMFHTSILCLAKTRPVQRRRA
jgi:glycosyltransferase involved in cell wall biosynthesis